MAKNLLETKEGSKFFAALAESDPTSALSCLERTIGTWGSERLLNFTEGRRQVIHSLEKIIVWKEFFQRGARLILKLAESENEKWANNATGIFKDLFSLGQGPVATTEASPAERFPILKEAISSNSEKKRLLALEACDDALRTGSHSRMVGNEYQGIKPAANLWTPKTWGELWDAYRYVWNLLVESIENLTENERQKALDILLNHAGDLIRMKPFKQMVIDTVKGLLDKPYVNKLKVLEKTLNNLRWYSKDYDDDVRIFWEEIRDSLTGKDFHSLLRRYIGISRWSDYTPEGTQNDEARVKINGLAVEALKNDDLLNRELKWLVTTEAQNAYSFGYHLAKHDKENMLLPRLLDNQLTAEKEASLLFLSGYIRFILERNKDEWENLLDEFSSRFPNWLLELTFRSGISDRAALRLLSKFKEGVISLSDLSKVSFAFQPHEVSTETFHQWIDVLLKNPEINALAIAIDWFGLYYVHKNPSLKIPKDLTYHLLTDSRWTGSSERIRRNGSEDYYWAEIAKLFLKQFPEESLPLGRFILDNFGHRPSIFDGFHDMVNNILINVVTSYPEEMWENISKHLEPMDVNSFYIQGLLSGREYFEESGEGLLSVFPANKVFDWVEQDVEKRARYIASFVPKELTSSPNWVREILIRYGDRKDVRDALHANFYTEGWMGEASLHYLKRKNEMLVFKNKETHPNVLKWIDEYLARLEQDIQRSKIEEEREK